MSLTASHATEVLESFNPATGEVVGTYPVHDEQAVQDAVARAREAARWWSGLGYDERKNRLLAWKRVIVRRIDELARLMHSETGKPADDARLETIGAIEHIDWAAKNARKVLGPRKVRPGALAMWA